MGIILGTDNGGQFVGHASCIQEEGAVAGEGVEMEQVESEDIVEPFDPATIRISTKEPTVNLVIERMRRKEIELQPDFQRSGDVWEIETRSRLVESLLLWIPLPGFYLAADEKENWKVVDGLQRLSTLRDFIILRTLRLQGLEYLSKFEKCGFDELPRPMQRRIMETQLSCHVIEPSTPPEVILTSPFRSATNLRNSPVAIFGPFFSGAMDGEIYRIG